MQEGLYMYYKILSKTDKRMFLYPVEVVEVFYDGNVKKAYILDLKNKDYHIIDFSDLIKSPAGLKPVFGGSLYKLELI